ncbi:MAG: UDP-N-acetylglucosamine 1-carboxyvinyltransferase [Candidatus Lloydbacteria bacterium RIFCSPLOWO2_01_FULL_50_20]|uniref:UDP-N-acetylglucosamine 1-carboxyvinyltransferase n=1 Tax=Candidatus Lloydbacteria bacterium RIFCSPLOWO2_01_FULL_50_20 TaxID=1798665 RepID=A0A1G2DD96_9BACT|nr:MAG: UDP-N-acetylglucosamine 1-carboxyvinyltransferase [Candidatus Lloydbacteria bacterium RIFCSPHIGHO2_02_FULL_50_11]OGZ11604.1 MAG: UDP-N-acetylglucosamine 1-carboxyvinyltransferase [Candidatus Lloydbacteria bacterium RIFCSPLOWO2_01_FULL_50_20]
MPEHFSIRGAKGRTLSGKIAVCGAKNAALKGVAASILFRTPLTLTNVPEIEDVSRMLEILRTMGAQITFGEHQATIDARGLSETTLTPDIAKRLRASIVLTGPILARHGFVRFPHPGGCVIGERPIDLFIEGYKKMGAQVKQSGKFYDIRAQRGGLRGAELFFRLQSVTGTETFMMAAVLAKGRTVIKNAAMEPEIKWLADLLNASGAHISGAGTPTITIEGGDPLDAQGKSFRVIPDRIEAGSFLILGALAAKRLLIDEMVPEHIESLIEILSATGVKIVRGERSLSVSAPKRWQTLRSVSVRTHEYPGLATDLQAPLTVFMTQALGESLVFETIFEGRLSYIESLNRMGANIAMMDPHRVLVKGPTPLSGKQLESPDLRAGLAFVIAAVTAEGTSVIHNIYNIDRGYERIEERLRAIGVDIVRAN